MYSCLSVYTYTHLDFPDILFVARTDEKKSGAGSLHPVFQQRIELEIQ